MRYDLVIVGGGLWGAAAAHAAVSAGIRSVLLLEAGIGLAQESSAKSGGILTDLLVEPEDQALVARSRELYRHALEGSGDASVMRRLGMLTLADGEFGSALTRRTKELGQRGVPFELLGNDEVGRRHPQLDRLADETLALWTPDDCHVNPAAYAQHVVQQARAQGLTVRTSCRAERLNVEPGKLSVTAGGEVHEGQRLLITAGTWSRKLLRTAGLDIPLLPYRVQLSSVRLAAPHRLPLVWHLASDVYLVPDGEESLLVGDGTRLSEFDPDDYPQTGDAEFEMNIAARLLQLSSLGDRAGLRSSWAGLAGGTPDRRPVLGRVTDGLFVACGDNGIGVMRGPAIGELAARVALDLAAAPHLRPDRFPPGPFEIRAGFTLE
ncbi:MAG: NAD(P)/FAD-dependent oxidoreductase [Candidatus Dormibacteria bacterium]